MPRRLSSNRQRRMMFVLIAQSSLGLEQSRSGSILRRTMSTPATRVRSIWNVTEIMDNAPFSALHWRAFLLCMACMMMDGFDVQVLGYTAPSIIREWGVPNAALGPVFAAANFGVLLGALLISMLADRIGRRPVIVAGALFVGAMTILTARATSVSQLLV